MKTITRHLIAGASVLALSVSAFAQSSSTSLKKEDLEASKSKFSGSFLFGVGQDTNIGDTKAGTTGSFYEIKPALNITNGIFSTDMSAGIKDYSDQQISKNAKETSAEIALGLNTQFGNTESATKLSLSYGDNRLPDYFNAGSTTTDGDGMPSRYVGTGLSQSLAWDFKKLNIKTEGSYLREDYSSTYSDFVGDLLGQQDFQLDNDKIEGKARVGIQLNQNVELAATPLISHQKYDDRQARESNGARIGDQGFGVGTGKMTEFVVNEMTAELIISSGGLSITPKVVSGLNIDQANGGEDYRYNEAGVSTAITINKANNVQLKASYSVKNENYDNYTAGVNNGETREDDIESASVGTSFNVSKSVSLAVDYSNTLETSNHPSQDLNYRQEIFSTGLTVSF